MGRLLTLSAAAFFLPVAVCDAHDFELAVDARVVTTDSASSFLHGGGGKLRFDEAHDGLQLGSVYLGYRGDLSDTLHFNADAFAYGDNDVNAIDLTELYLSWRPVPTSTWRSEIKLGAFYAPISLENRMRGWRSPYSLSFSAINTWVGEELRTIGMEYDLDWLGQQTGRPFNVGFTAALYGWNDSAGVVIASRGWALHDRQTALFGRVGEPNQGFVPGRTLFYDDIDHRVGYYAGLKANYRAALELRVLHYDNRADPTIEAPAIDDYAWKTAFDSAGVRWAPGSTWTFIAQWLKGKTYAIAEQPSTEWDFESHFLLASWQHANHRLTARFDAFSMDQREENWGLRNRDRGNALTLAYSYDVATHWNLTLEALRVDSSLAARVRVNESVSAVENQVQLAVRYSL